MLGGGAVADLDARQTGDIRQANRRRWLVLIVGVAAQASTCAFIYGLPFLVPNMQREQHLSLAEAGVVVAAPTIGLMLTLIAWGAAADRYGEKIVITVGLGGCGVVAVLAVTTVRALPPFVVLLGLA